MYSQMVALYTSYQQYTDCADPTKEMKQSITGHSFMGHMVFVPCGSILSMTENILYDINN